ncbi:uncharacterized protein [Triticum aestivum]|uniref:uncharacterized protein n=1 Tax=Triticum aestivum TaxID=4565 RepID=UPI001D0088F0|nr:uncharacterized protein LOC123053917 [Triticum aestivum]
MEPAKCRLSSLLLVVAATLGMHAVADYTDGDAHCGFSPNVTFPHVHPAQRTPSPAFAGVQYPPYNYSPPTYVSSPTPPLRRGALPFSQASTSHLGDTDATEADMEDIITAGSAAAAASPRFAIQDDTVDLSGGMDGELEYGEEEPDEQEEEEEEPAPVPARGRKKKKGAARTGGPPCDALRTRPFFFCTPNYLSDRRTVAADRRTCGVFCEWE